MIYGLIKDKIDVTFYFWTINKEISIPRARTAIWIGKYSDKFLPGLIVAIIVLLVAIFTFFTAAKIGWISSKKVKRGLDINDKLSQYLYFKALIK